VLRHINTVSRSQSKCQCEHTDSCISQSVSIATAILNEFKPMIASLVITNYSEVIAEGLRVVSRIASCRAL
jgi:hypothetical protein